MKITQLRSRIVLSLVLIVTVISTLFASGLLYIKAELESVSFGHMVRGQLDFIIDHMERGQFHEDSLEGHWLFYRGDDIRQLPEKIRQLGPGSYHSVQIDNRFYQVEVSQWNEEAVFLVYDITRWEDQEHDVLTLLVAGVGIVLLVAIVLGFQASRVILSPVHRLSQRLATISPHQRNARIAEEFRGSEIGLIAQAFDQYLDRLDQFVVREQSFTASASHELRTPLAVMVGALDILESHEQPARAQRATARLRRACNEMHAFIEAALFLSREDSATLNNDGHCEIRQVIDKLAEDYQPLLDQHDISLHTRMTNNLSLKVPTSVVQITLSNLLRNAIEHSGGSRIDIELKNNTVTLSDNGRGIPAQHLDHIFDLSYTTKPDGNGMGLNLVRRICDRFHWQIAIDSHQGQGTTVTLTFDGTPT